MKLARNVRMRSSHVVAYTDAISERANDANEMSVYTLKKTCLCHDPREREHP